MKFKSILAILLLFCFLLPSCASSLTDLPEETAATAESKAEEQEENGNEGKEEQKNEEKKTEEKKEPVKKPIMQTANPADDNEFNVLMIGNSFCYFFVEELYGIAKAAGVELKEYHTVSAALESPAFTNRITKSIGSIPRESAAALG